ncbi:MAG TPA: class I SAM-dependent methyltransferase [Burkholderiales bacterium]|nr:class I SAM-dependent methyltransferase [Burkholderiales bacterium]
MSVVCISCRTPAASLGPLPDSNLFAGRALPATLPGGHLYRCPACRLGFRHPRLPKAQLDALYAAGSEGSWTWEASDRTDWTLAAQTLRELLPGAARVLDIGCFDGTFLASLGPDVDKYGIEIMPSAADAARSKGIRIVASDFASLASTPGAYDAITAFDVIEHVEDPVAFLALLARAMRPGGVIVVSTGNLDAWSWALMRSSYWYCAIPEHISFLSESWFRHAARTLGLVPERVVHYPHAKATLKRRVFETAANFTYLVAPSAIAALRRRGVGNISRDLAPELGGNYPPGWFTATDHVLVTLRAA